MAIIAGTQVPGQITVGDPSISKYGTHYSFLGTGGYQEVLTIIDRDAIPVDIFLNDDTLSSGRRRLGMLVYCVDTDQSFILGKGLTESVWNALSSAAKIAFLADNLNWIETSNSSAIETITAGENLVTGDLVYLKTDGKYWKADYLDETKVSTELRYVLGTITTNATGSAQITGNVTSSGLTVGERYCVGVNGAIVLESAIPDTEGIFVRYVGTAESATDLFFNPESTYIEVTLTPPSGTAGINRLIENRSGVTVTLGNSVLTDYVQNCTGTNTLTLPSAIGNNNKYTITLISGTTTLNFLLGQTGNGSSSIVMNTPYLSYDFISDNSNWIIR